MTGESLARQHAIDESCPSCGTPIKHGMTTHYLEDLDTEICVVCEQPLKTE